MIFSRNATQRNATQRNATQRNATQRNAGRFAPKKLVPNILIFGGVIVCCLGLAVPIESKTLLIYGVKNNLGVIDGDNPMALDFRVFNPHLVPVAIDVHAPGCTADGNSDQLLQVQPLTSQWIHYPFDPTHLRVGPGLQTIIILAYVNHRPERVMQSFTFTVKRMGLTKIGS